MDAENLNPPARHDNDIWSKWLMHERHADSPNLREVVRNNVDGYVKRVLDGVRLEPGMTLLDVGTGEGVVAFRAIERVGGSLKVVLTDVSEPMLGVAKSTATELNLLEQCQFLAVPADDLSVLGDGSVDVVTTRSVLAYVQDKDAALREFFRVLKPGGRASLAEPVFWDEALAARVLRLQAEAAGSRPSDLFVKLMHRWKAAQFPDTEEGALASPITNYSERELLQIVQRAGFKDIHMEFVVDVHPSPITSWDDFVGSTPHPWAPPLKEIFETQFSREEQEFFESLVRPTVESGANTEIDRMVYITATRPLSRLREA